MEHEQAPTAIEPAVQRPTVRARVSGAIPVPIRRAVLWSRYVGLGRYCPLCRRQARAFRPFGRTPRPDVRCPWCNSLERHRLLWRFLEERIGFANLEGKAMLHVAPEACLTDRLRAIVGRGYVTADLFAPADIRLDICDMNLSDASFDVAYCSHVFEHVGDDRRAMREFRRILRPDGWAILLVPITASQTIEDPTLTDPAERFRQFGQEDHVRRYGPDYVDRLVGAGFTVETVHAADFLLVDEIRRLAIGDGGGKLMNAVFLCRRTRPSVRQ